MGHGTLEGGSLSHKGRLWFARECLEALGIGCGDRWRVGFICFVQPSVLWRSRQEVACMGAGTRWQGCSGEEVACTARSKLAWVQLEVPKETRGVGEFEQVAGLL